MAKEFIYKEWVEECYKKRLDQEIHNASEENALLLFQKLLDKAYRDKEDVKIISNQLLANFYNKLVEKVQQILQNGNTVEVIVEKEIDDKENNKFYQLLKKNVLLAMPKFKELPNFIVVGNNAYRHETDKESTKAIANFNNENIGSFMVEMFNDLKLDIQKV